jgi:ABC-type multidrug transport system ATPase subunit
MLEDEDIIEEERRVEGIPSNELTVRVNKLRKTFGKSVAVKKVSFGLEYGECFALLGVSGAGKTTTFKCLTGEEIPSSGDLHIQGFDVTTAKGFEKARKLIGYCP